MDNRVQRGGRMLGNSKLYGSNRPQQNDWRFGDSRMLDCPRAFKDSQIQGNSRQHGDFRMQESRLQLESRMEPNYSPPRVSDMPEVQGNSRLPERARGGSHLPREVRAHPESRMHAGSRAQGNSRICEDLAVHDQLRSRSDAVAYDYNHRRSDEHSPLADTGVQSNFMINSNENVRSGRSSYNIQDDNIRQGFSDILPGLPNDASAKKTLDLLPPKSYAPVSGMPPGSGHILTPSLTSFSGPQTVDAIRSTGNRSSYPKEKSSKAFDYLKTWRLKMNMPTDAFLLEKEGTAGNQQQGHDAISHTHDDWYTQPPPAEPRVGRASVDSEWNLSGNSFTEKDAFGERSGSSYREMRYGTYNESVAAYPRDQIRESDRTGNPAWKWDEEVPSSQGQSAKRNYDSMASGHSFNSAHRDGRYLQGEMMPAKRSRLSPSQLQNDREPVEQYTSISQETLSQTNVSYSDDSKFKINSSDTFYESHSDWKSSSFHRGPPVDSSKFARSPHDSRGESVGSRHKLFPGEMKGMIARESSQAPYLQSRDARNISHNLAHTSEPSRRHRYNDAHPQDRATRLIGHGRSPELNQGSMNQGRPPPNEMFMASAPYSMDMSPKSYPRSRSDRSPCKVKSPGPGMRGRSPFPQDKAHPMAPRASDLSSPWRKGKSPGLARGRPLAPERERSPVLAGRESPRPTIKGRSPGPRGRGPSGKQRSPGPERLLGPPRRNRSPEVARRVKSPGPPGRMRSPGPLRRGRSPDPQERGRSPESIRRERSPGLLGRGRSLDHARWKSPGRGKSPALYGREKPLGPSGRGKTSVLTGKGRSPVPSGGGRSPGPSRRPPSGALERGRSPIKSHSGRRDSQGSPEQGKLLPKPSGRGTSPGPIRGRPSAASGRARSPGAGGRDRSPGNQGRGKQSGASGMGRSPKPPATGKASKTIEGRSSELVPHRAAEYQEQPRARSPSTGLGAQRRPIKGQTSSPRGRSPLKGKSPRGTRIRSDSFSQGKGGSLVKERSVRLDNRSAQSPVNRLAPSPREKHENLIEHEYREYRDKRERSPYLEEISLSPRSNRFWSPTRRAVVNVRSQHSRERSRSVDAPQRGYSPVSPHPGGYSGSRTHYPQESFVPEREALVQQDRPSHFYRECSPLSADGSAPVRKSNVEAEMKDRGRSQRERYYSPSREVSFGARRHSTEKIHNAKGNWRERDKDSSGQRYDGKKGSVSKISDSKDAKKARSNNFPDASGGILSEEEVDDEDLRIHLLRLREQKVEMKLMKLEEESKETELKLRELKKNRVAPRGESPIEKERRYFEKEIYHLHGQRQDPYPWKHQRSPSPQQERYHRQHKKY